MEKIFWKKMEKSSWDYLKLQYYYITSTIHYKKLEREII